MKKTIFLAMFFLAFLACSSESETVATDTTLYFPPNESSVWETKSISELGWNQSAVNPLLSYLEEKNTKGFIILVDGKIVMENYFNGHSASSNWYWASAGKTLTATILGIAEQENFLNINDKVSNYIETGWTSEALTKFDYKQTFVDHDCWF